MEIAFKNRKIEHEQQKALLARETLYRKVFDNPDGQAVLKDLKARCFIDHTSYPGNDQIGQWGINEGRRSIYAYIVNFLCNDIQTRVEEVTKE